MALAPGCQTVRGALLVLGIDGHPPPLAAVIGPQEPGRGRGFTLLLSALVQVWLVLGRFADQGEHKADVPLHSRGDGPPTTEDG